MWIEQKKDLIIIGQGMGKEAFVFYHRFWGVVAVANCPSAEKVANSGNVCEFEIFISYQAKASQIERLIRNYCGQVWGALSFKYTYVNKDWVGIPEHLKIRMG